MNPTQQTLQCLQPLLNRDREEAPVSPVRAKWRGREAELLPLPARKLDEGDELSAREGAVAFATKYGSYVEKQLHYDLKSKPLNQRTLKKLETEASSLLRDVRKLNRSSIEYWLDSGLVEKAFESATPFKWRSLPPHEQEHLEEVLQFQLSLHTDYLSYSKALDLAVKAVSQHESVFAAYAPGAARFLNEESQGGQSLFPGQLRLWAQQHYDKDQTPGTVIEEGGEDLYISEYEMKLIGNAEYYTNRVAGLLSGSPLERLEHFSYEQQAEEARDVAKKLIKTLDALERHGENIPSELTEALKQDLIGQLDGLLDFIDHLEVSDQEDPLGPQQWEKFKYLEVLSSIKVLEREIVQIKSSGDEGSLSRKKTQKLAVLEALHQEWSAHLTSIQQGNDNDFPPARSHSTGRVSRSDVQPLNDAKAYTASILKQLDEVGLGKAEKKLKHARSLVLSTVKWETVTTHLDVRIEGQVRHYENQLTPASQMKWGEGDRDVFEHSYHGTGRPSTETKELFHAMNMGQSELSTTVKGKKRVLFKGLRSGTLSAYGIKDKKPRQAAARNRARELVTAGVKQFLEDNPGYLTSSKPIPLKLLSTSLLSADKLRHYLHIHDDELTMQRVQVAALKKIQKELNGGKPLVFFDANGTEHKLMVDMKLANTNYGVNSLSLGGLKSIVRPWGEAKGVNKEGLVEFIGSVDQFDPIGGWVGDYLAGSASEESKNIVRMLVEQVRDLHASGDYRSEGEDAYKMIERLQLLAFKIGAVGHINCKSGKDRTGEADASIKRFAAEVEARGYVPDPRKPISREDRNLSQAFQFGSGNIEWQQMNINRPGFKTQLNKKRLGEFAYQRSHKARFKVK
ncbi:inositol phosphate phosphatase SopB [Endozoicomonas arenosclerae]|uniref:inositol phosphate phosphatase SopB n=1 Tax=Endozoicomonas arenosclerae TaxID=1633495 RepID=UPI000A7518CC|nr:inositol phosphate phosphatase SopB [Endozoicomonas arenosclerae]